MREFTVDSNTLALLHFNNNVVKDEIVGNVWEAVNSPVIDNGDKRTGSGSIKVNGNNYVKLTNRDFSTLAEWTIECWFKNTTMSTTLDGILGNYLEINSTIHWYAAIFNGTFMLVTTTEHSIDSINDNNWHHFAICKGFSSAEIYLDGKLKFKPSLSEIPLYREKPICVGYLGDMRYKYPDRGLRGNIDEFRISDIVRYTADFNPILTSNIYLNANNEVYGNSSGFKKLSDDWTVLSDNDKLSLVNSIDDNATISDLSTIGKFKVIATQESTPVTNATVTAIPKTQTIYPTKLIKTAPFEKLNSVSITATASGAGDIKVAVTTDLTNYKIWDKVTLAWTDIPKSDVATRGMSVSDISTLTDTEWNMLVSYGVGDGIAFAYSLDITVDTDKAEIDELTLNAEMRGSWNKAFHGVDYTYGYPFYDQLSVKLLKDGSYKINYHD